MGDFKLAHVTSALGRDGGGVSTVVEALSREQAVFGYNVEVFAIKTPQWELSDANDWAGSKCNCYPFSVPSKFFFSQALLNGLRSFCPDAIHLHGLWTFPSVAAKWISGWNNIPRVISPHGMLDSWALDQSGSLKRLALQFYERSNLNNSVVHALCEPEYQSIRAVGVNSPVVIIPNGVTIETQEHSTTAPWFDLVPSGSKVLFFLGRIHPKKGLYRFIRLLSTVRDTLVDKKWFFVVAGWDEVGHLADLKALTAELHMENCVLFVGPLFGKAKDAAYRASTVFVLPSHSEGLPMTVLEAWSNGRPSLITPECNLETGFSEGAAWPLRFDSEVARLQVLQVLNMSEDRIERAGQAGRELVSRLYTWSAVCRQFDELFHSTCRRK